MSLLFIILCRFTYLWTPLFVSVYDRKLSVLNVFKIRKSKLSHHHQDEFDLSMRFVKTNDNDERMKIESTHLDEYFRYDIHE
jgi:hypothetical protein